VPDIIDAINLKGAAFCIEHEYFEFAEEMLSELSPTCLASSRTIALRQRVRDIQISFWKTRYALKQMDAAHRARARYALQWRPHFLAALALSHSPRLAARAAHISPMTAYSHRRNDPEFAEQWEEAESHATDLIVGRAFQRALEGDCEPIFYKGKVVAHVRKFDTNVQIAVLRALRPDKFKTPGTQVNIGTKGDVFTLSEEQRHELQRINRDWLLSTPVENDTSLPAGAEAGCGEA
jgi:hypothetical protein